MSLADQIIEHEPWNPHGLGSIDAGGDELNELRDELIAARNLRSHLARYELDIKFWDDEANLRCDSCGATWDFGNDRTLAADEVLVGVAIVGRPVARSFDDGRTLEVTRVATDGTPNASSMLYAAAWRAASAMGFRRLVTYTQHGESGASLRAAGWSVIAERPPRPGWNMPSRPRQLRGTESVQRYLWEAAS